MLRRLAPQPLPVAAVEFEQAAKQVVELLPPGERVEFFVSQLTDRVHYIVTHRLPMLEGSQYKKKSAVSDIRPTSDDNRVRNALRGRPVFPDTALSNRRWTQMNTDKIRN